MLNIDEDTITQAVIARHSGATDVRLRELMTSLVQHLHAFARDVRLTEAEWTEGLRFLAEVGRVDDGDRREFVLLSDTLGLSTLVTALNQRKPAGCTEASVRGPLPAAGAGRGAGGEPCYVRGRVKAPDGTPLAGAQVQVWQADAAGWHPLPGHESGDARGWLTSAADGGFDFRCSLAEPYPVPHDGPVGQLLARLGRHPWRPAHLHFVVSAPGHERLVTHVFRAGGRYLDSDAVFGVRRSLIADWVRHEPGPTPDGGRSAVPFYSLEFDFVLATSGTGGPTR